MNSGSYLGGPFDSSSVGCFDAGTKVLLLIKPFNVLTNSADNTFMKTFNKSGMGHHLILMKLLIHRRRKKMIIIRLLSLFLLLF